jgi:hypothetical protein
MPKYGVSGAKFVKFGYGQVEPNHLSAPRNGQVYAQLPAAKGIDKLENGQFVKYDYAAGVCDFSTDATSGEWMMVYNEVKIYRDYETDADFAMLASDYNARIYSPIGQNTSDLTTIADYSNDATLYGTNVGYKYQNGTYTYGAEMPDGTSMVPRVLKISVGDIYTTNAVNEDSLAVKDLLYVGADGFLAKSGDENGPVFAVVKVYTMPDNQPGVKVQRVA